MTTAENVEHDGNPPAGSGWRGGWFYLASALSMLVGYYVLARAMPDRDGRFAGLIAMVLSLEVYEFLLVGLGLFLVVRSRAVRDGVALVLLALLFVADATFLDYEVVTADADAGAGVLGAVLALALVKGGLVLRLLGIRLPAARRRMLLVEAAALFATPVVLAQANRIGGLDSRVLYFAFWGAGLLLAAKGVVRARSRDGAGSGEERLVRAALEWLPGASLLVHLFAAGFVFDEPFRGVFAGPLFLGFALLFLLAPPGALKRDDRSAVVHIFPLLAILVSAAPPGRLELTMLGTSVTPFRLALTGAAVVWFVGARILGRRHLHVGGAAALLTAVAGPTPEAAFERLVALFPDSELKWGIAAVAAAFVLLGIGALLSLRRGRVGPTVLPDVARDEAPAGTKRAPRRLQPVAALLCTLGALVVGISFAVPNFRPTRCTGGNETAAIATLRNLWSAQAQFQAACAVDEDGDGQGEFGTFAELSGAVAPRGANKALSPPVLSGAFRRPDARGIVSRSGYYFRIWLPGRGGRAVGDPHDALTDPDRAETTFCAYAWPVNQGNSGWRSFYLAPDGGIFATEDERYDGPVGPAPAAASAGRMWTDPPSLRDQTSRDGNVWKRVN